MAAPAHRRYAEPPGAGREIELPRGDVTEGVVRVGDTVRRPHQPQSLAVASYLDHLEAAGFDAAPRYLGRDRAGRDVLSFLPGEVAGDPPEAWAADGALLASVAGLVARLHAASAGYRPPAGAVWGRDLVRLPAVPRPLPGPPDEPELVSHNDVTPQNVVVRAGRAVGLVDFDLSGPTTRLRDAYNTAMHWVPLRDPADLWPAWRGVDQPARLRIFADAYGLTGEQRAGLADLGIDGAERSWHRMRAAAAQLGGGWARMWSAGAGEVIRRRGAWLAAHRDELTAALLSS